MAPLFRMNAPKAVKDRAKTLQSKARELHDVMRDNPSLQLAGRVATVAETKHGFWEVFVSCKPEDVPIDFSQMPEFDIKYPDNYRTIADSTTATAGMAINPGPSVLTRSAAAQDHASSVALSESSAEARGLSVGQTPSSQHRSVPQQSFLPSPTSRGSPEQYQTASSLPASQPFEADSVQPTASPPFKADSTSSLPASNGSTIELQSHSSHQNTHSATAPEQLSSSFADSAQPTTSSNVPALNGPMEYHSHSLPPTREMPYQHSPSAHGAPISNWTSARATTVNPCNLAAFNGGMSFGYNGGRSHGQFPICPDRPYGSTFSSPAQLSSVQCGLRRPSSSPRVTPSPRSPSARAPSPLTQQSPSAVSYPTGLGGATRPSSAVGSSAGPRDPPARPLTPLTNLLLACQTPQPASPEFSPSPSALRTNSLTDQRSLQSLFDIPDQASVRVDHRPPPLVWDSDQDSDTTAVGDAIVASDREPSKSLIGRRRYKQSPASGIMKRNYDLRNRKGRTIGTRLSFK